MEEKEVKHINNQKINIKFLFDKKNNYKETHNTISNSLVKLFLLKEISNKLNIKIIQNLPNDLIKNILEILKIGFIDEEHEENYEEENIIRNVINILEQKEGSNILNFSKYIDKIVNLTEINHLLKYLKDNDYIKINEIKNRLLTYETEINLFNEQFLEALKNSIIEFSLISLILIERKDFGKLQETIVLI